MQDYCKRPDLTAQAIRDGWIFTGGMGYVDEDGHLYLVDRKKDMIDSGGMKVYPKVEEIAAHHPAIREVAAAVARGVAAARRARIRPRDALGLRQDQQTAPMKGTSGGGWRRSAVHAAALDVLMMRIPLAVLLFGALASVTGAASAHDPSAGTCVPVAAWRTPGADSAALTTGEVLARADGSRVVLLGENHASAEHHRWQLAMLGALHARNPNLVLGFEMFPRRAQPVLDRWVAGELVETELLKQTDWANIWRFDPAFYLPLFHFARMNRVPMVALNVDMTLIREVGTAGLAGVDAARREGVTQPAPPQAAYLARLRQVFDQHKDDGISGKGGGDAEAQFSRFVESQQVWDRAMAQGIADALARHRGATVVGIMGSGHIVYGNGVAFQLRDLGVDRVASLLPWDANEDCDDLKTAGIADAVFGVAAAPKAEAAADRPRLGIWLDGTDSGVKIREVTKGSVAEASGLKADDVIVEIAGRSAQQPTDVIGAVNRQAPGTWLPIKVQRGGQTIEIVAKFPPTAR